MSASDTRGGRFKTSWPKTATPQDTRLRRLSFVNSPPLASPAPQMRVPSQGPGNTPAAERIGSSGGGGTDVHSR
eukprot:6379709-Pyramimonas_sp.AAC.1